MNPEIELLKSELLRLTQRVVELEKVAHSPVDLRPAIKEEINTELDARGVPDWR